MRSLYRIYSRYLKNENVETIHTAVVDSYNATPHSWQCEAGEFVTPRSLLMGTDDFTDMLLPEHLRKSDRKEFKKQLHEVFTEYKKKLAAEKRLKKTKFLINEGSLVLRRKFNRRFKDETYYHDTLYRVVERYHSKVTIESFSSDLYVLHSRQVFKIVSVQN